MLQTAACWLQARPAATASRVPAQVCRRQVADSASEVAACARLAGQEDPCEARSGSLHCGAPDSTAIHASAVTSVLPSARSPGQSGSTSGGPPLSTMTSRSHDAGRGGQDDARDTAKRCFRMHCRRMWSVWSRTACVLVRSGNRQTAVGAAPVVSHRAHLCSCALVER